MAQGTIGLRWTHTTLLFPVKVIWWLQSTQLTQRLRLVRELGQCLRKLLWAIRLLERIEAGSVGLMVRLVQLGMEFQHRTGGTCKALTTKIGLLL
jgi:hypothetical protein